MPPRRISAACRNNRELTCQNVACGRTFTVYCPPSRKAPRFCSIGCVGQSREGGGPKMTELTCQGPECGKKFHRYLSPCRTIPKCCSRECGYRLRAGRKTGTRKTLEQQIRECMDRLDELMARREARKPK